MYIEYNSTFIFKKKYLEILLHEMKIKFVVEIALIDQVKPKTALKIPKSVARKFALLDVSYVIFMKC